MKVKSYRVVAVYVIRDGDDLRIQTLSGPKGDEPIELVIRKAIAGPLGVVLQRAASNHRGRRPKKPVVEALR